MSDVVIRVEHLSKSYQYGTISHGTLTKDLQSWWARVRGKDDPNTILMHSRRSGKSGQRFWALQDVSFDVKQGEIVGIIGRNGAGKSTLLKILSEITTPTQGCVKLNGRVGSLLEVGTGFHPELTGRENIYLNGAILGMTRAEITKKFDEIVAFAEVEEFLDTPVKRYSSGMYVRLAFAVAAHLEPEILLVDEVLAVGDTQFQKKCLGKMGEVTKEGRTVLFVSHNMPSIESLCSHGLIFDQGRIIFDGNISGAVNRYLSMSLDIGNIPIKDRTYREGNGEAVIKELELIAPEGIASGKPLSIIIHYESIDKTVTIVHAGLSIWTLQDIRLISLMTKYQPGFPSMPSDGKVVCTIPELPIMPGQYFINPSIYTLKGLADYVDHAMQFSVENADFYRTGKMPNPSWSLILVRHQWTIKH